MRARKRPASEERTPAEEKADQIDSEEPKEPKRLPLFPLIVSALFLLIGFAAFLGSNGSALAGGPVPGDKPVDEAPARTPAPASKAASARLDKHVEAVQSDLHADAQPSLVQAREAEHKEEKIVPVSVGQAMREELNNCASMLGSSPVNASMERLECVFGLIYPSNNAQAEYDATYGYHETSAHIYGEIPNDSVVMVIKELGIGPGSVFYDLGSGIGHMTLQVHLTTDAARAVGIEIATLRHEVGMKALKLLKSAGMDTLLDYKPQGKHEVELLCENITKLDLSDATGIYMASLFFPRDIMWMLAHKLSDELKDGSKIFTLVKFPFDMYGPRTIAKDSPLQALILRKTYQGVRMSWSEENTVFLYEVNRAEAFRPPFNVKNATNVELLDEVYRQLGTNRAQAEVPALNDAMYNAVLSLGPAAGDQMCELGTILGSLPLRLSLETEMDRVTGVTSGNKEHYASQARKLLGQLAPERLPWYRRVDMIKVPKLSEFISGADGADPNDKEGFGKTCGEATIVTMNSVDYSFGGELDALAILASRLQAGTVILIYGLESAKPNFCTPGLLPLFERSPDIALSAEVSLTTPLAAFVVAAREVHVAALQLPGMTDLRSSIALADVSREKMEEEVAEHLFAAARKRGNPDSEDRGITQSNFRDVIEISRFKRLQHILGGLIAHEDGRCEPRSPPKGKEHHQPAVPAPLLAKLFLSRFFGGAVSPYLCFEQNLYTLAPYAPKITKDEKSAGLFPKQTATYGEIDPRGIAGLMRQLGGLNKSDVFFDLGSGLGKAGLQVFFGSQVSRVVGVELSESRHEWAVDALDVIKRRWATVDEILHSDGRSVQFFHEDILKADITGATVIWMGSLAFPPELMIQIGVRLLDQASAGCKILSMVQFPLDSIKSSRPRELVHSASWMTRVRWADKEDGGHAFLYEILEHVA